MDINQFRSLEINEICKFVYANAPKSKSEEIHELQTTDVHILSESGALLFQMKLQEKNCYKHRHTKFESK